MAKGRGLAVQACRHSGASSVTAKIQFTKVNFRAIARREQGPAVVLARVRARRSRGTRPGWQSLGLDLADHGTAAYRDVMLYSGRRAGRAAQRLASIFRVREADVLAKRKRDIASEKRAAKPRSRGASAR